MKRKKGFTLIELLAVIVILAIIALITTPIILNMIENAKKQATISSSYGYIEAIENYQVLSQLNSNEILKEGHYNVATKTDLKDSEGNIIKSVDKINNLVKMKGKKPIAGTVDIASNKQVSGATLCMNGYVVRYLNEESEIIAHDCDDMYLLTDLAVEKEGWQTERKLTINYPEGNYKYYYKVSGTARVNDTLVETNKEIEATNPQVLMLEENQIVETWIIKNGKKIAITKYEEEKIDPVEPIAPIASGITGYPTITADGIKLSTSLEIKNFDKQEGSSAYYKVEDGEWIKYTKAVIVNSSNIKVKMVRNISKIESEEKEITLISGNVSSPLPSAAYNGNKTSGFTYSYNSNATSRTYYTAVSSEMYNRPINLRASLRYDSYWGNYSSIKITFLESDKTTAIGSTITYSGNSITSINKDIIIPEGTKYIAFNAITSHAPNGSDFNVTIYEVSVIDVIEPIAIATTVYPLITKDGIKRQVELNITSKQNGATAYYSVNDENIWIKYTDVKVIEANSIKVKMVNDSKKVESSIKDIKINEGNNVMPLAGYDDSTNTVSITYNSNSPSKVYYFSVDSGMYNRTINLRASLRYDSYWGNYSIIKITYLESDKTTAIGSTITYSGNYITSVNKNLTIPDGTKYIALEAITSHAPNGSDFNVTINKISVIK